MTQIQESLNVISPETISPRLNKYLTQIDRLNIPQYVQLEEEAQQNINNNLNQLPQFTPKMIMPPSMMQINPQLIQIAQLAQSNPIQQQDQYINDNSK